MDSSSKDFLRDTSFMTAAAPQRRPSVSKTCDVETDTGIGWEMCLWRMNSALDKELVFVQCLFQRLGQKRVSLEGLFSVVPDYPLPSKVRLSFPRSG